MAENTKIEWAHHTANLWWGCTEVHSGCDFCYAKTFSNRYDGGKSLWGNDAPRREIKDVWKSLDKYQRKAAAVNEVHRVFVGSMMDIFEKEMPLVDSKGNEVFGQDTSNLRFHLFYRIDRGDYPNLMFLFLTKRPSNINKMIFESWKESPPANVMFGTSVVDQKTADTLIPQLLKVRGKRFLSCEPLLGPMDITKYLHESICDEYGRCGYCDPIEGEPVEDRIDWLIAGGESGHKARPMLPEWVTSLRDQCKTANVPFLFKQWGEWAPVYTKSGDYNMYKSGKKVNGNQLEGKYHLEFPKH
jgi:protein gp37